MPQTVNIPYTESNPDNFYDGRIKYARVEIATEDELLEFCNHVREAGGAEILEALLPSRPGNANECLIANALNFGCSVRPAGEKIKGLFEHWYMSLPNNLTLAQRAAIGEAVGNSVQHNALLDRSYVILPPQIGNAAHAFDEGVAFTDFDKGRS